MNISKIFAYLAVVSVAVSSLAEASTEATGAIRGYPARQLGGGGEIPTVTPATETVTPQPTSGNQLSSSQSSHSNGGVTQQQSAPSSTAGSGTHSGVSSTSGSASTSGSRPLGEIPALQSAPSSTAGSGTLSGGSRYWGSSSGSHFSDEPVVGQEDPTNSPTTDTQSVTQSRALRR